MKSTEFCVIRREYGNRPMNLTDNRHATSVRDIGQGVSNLELIAWLIEVNIAALGGLTPGNRP